MSSINDILKEAFQKEEMALDMHQEEKFARYYELLVEYNEKINLTAITEPKDVVIKHFVDSLLARKLLSNWQGIKLIDVGTGAGFPGVPLKIMEKDLHVTLFDSLQKRLKFLDLLCAELQLDEICTVHGRAEDGGKMPQFREQFDVATARAVAKMPILLEYTLPFVKVGGFFIALKGPELEAELAESKKALQVLGAKVEEVKHFTLAEDYTRNIALIRKTAPTPKAYPRKAGTPQKKPLI